MQSNEKYKRLKIRREEKWTRCRRKRIEEEGESVVSSRRLNMAGKKFHGGSSIQRTSLWER